MELTHLNLLRSRVQRLIARAKARRRRTRVAWLEGYLFGVEVRIRRAMN